MNGDPVWLASVSKRGKTGVKPTTTWTAKEFADAERAAMTSLKNVGNPNRMRAFRMNVTFCIHRALSDVEYAEIISRDFSGSDQPPLRWGDLDGGMAGGPVEVLWSRGIEHTEAAMPCHNPYREQISDNHPDLWLPFDCGSCPPCRARETIYRVMTRNITPIRNSRAND